AHEPLFRANPQIPIAVLEKRIDLVEGQAFIVQHIIESAFVKAVQTAVGPHPKIPLLIFANRADKSVGETVARVVSIKTCPPIPVIPQQAVVGTDPDAAARVLANAP